MAERLNNDIEAPDAGEVIGRLRTQDAILNAAATFGDGVVRGSCSPEDVLLRTIAFESRVGGFNDPAKDFELDVVADPPTGDRHIHFESHADGTWDVQFDGVEGCDR